MLQSLSAAAHRAGRRHEGRTMDSTTSTGSSTAGRCRPHHPLAGAPRAAPGDKINHALVLGGAQGIGKDTLLEPVKHAVGPWNFHEVSPAHLLGDFNGFVKSVILRVNEARDLGEINRFNFYDHTKIYTAAPPDVLRVEREASARALRRSTASASSSPPTTRPTASICRPTIAAITWRGPTAPRRSFRQEYWNELWGWYDTGGFEHVAAYLAELDLSAFDPKAPPPKTAAFWDIVTCNSAPEDAELADVLDALGNPDAVTPNQLLAKARAIRRNG